jgi:DNA replication protein DnaC
MNIKILEKPILKKCKMNCDEIIDKSLLKYDMVSDVWSRTSFNVICGSMGQGKTSLITNLVKTVFKKCFFKIYIFIPELSRKSIENDIYGRHLPEEQLYDELNEENLQNVYDALEENSSNGDYSLLIIDDFQTELKNPIITRVLQRIITKMRHLRTTVFLLQQNFIKLEKSIRNLCSNLILFNVGKSQLEIIFQETISLNKNKYQLLIDEAFKEKGDWILINMNGSRKIYRMFDEIVFT